MRFINYMKQNTVLSIREKAYFDRGKAYFDRETTQKCNGKSKNRSKSRIIIVTCG